MLTGAAQPGKPDALDDGLARVEALLAGGQVQAALDHATGLLGDEATHARALLRLSLLFATAGLHGQALKLSDRMARLAPDTAETRSFNACCLFAAGRVAQAHAQALAALRLDPENLDALRIALKASLQGVGDTGQEARAATLLREGDRQQDAALALACLASLSRGEPFGAVYAADGLLTGFALSLAEPGQIHEIELWLGDFRLARLAAGQQHPTLAMAGLPDGHAFTHRIPAELLGVELSLRLASGKECLGSPLRPADGLSPVEGRVGTAGADVIEGHAWRRCAPGKRLLVALEGESGRRCNVAASVFRKDLALAGVHDGRHGFSVKWPLPEGAVCESVQAKELKTGQPLAGSPVLVFDAGLAAEAVKDANGWLRLAAERPDAPPPLPPSLRGPALGLLRGKLAQWARELDALAARDDEP